MRHLGWMVASGCLLLCGCKSERTRELEYMNAFRQLSEEFHRTGLQMHSEPLPVDRSMPREQRLRALADSIRNTASRLDPLAQKSLALNPPSRFQELDRRVDRFYTEQPRLWRAWADAVETSSGSLARRKGEEIDVFMLEAFGEIVKEMERLGLDRNDIERLRTLQRELAQSLGR